MRAVLDIRTIQYMNLFERVTGVKPKDCFTYNTTIIFTVPHSMMNHALGRGNFNLNKLSNKINRRVRIIPHPSGIEDLERFIGSMVYPYKFKRIFFEDEELIILSMPRIKSVLIGRNKTRLKELSDAMKRFFGIKRVSIR